MSDSPPNVTKGGLPVISNLTLRLVLLRLICCLAVAAFIYTLVAREYTIIPISVFILLHHIMIPFFPRLVICNGLDLLITIVEIGALLLVAAATIMNWSRLTKTYIVAATIWWMLLISVAMFAGLKIINTIAVKGKNLLVRLDITDAQWMYSVSKNDPGESISSNSKPKKLTARDVLIGRSLWRAKLAGEQKWMILSRGLIAFLFVVIMVTFTIVAVIFGPVRASALRPVNTLRAFSLPSDAATLDFQIVRNIIMVRAVTNKTLSRSEPQTKDFARGIRITLLWNNSHTKPCITHNRKPYNARHTFSGYDYVQAVRFDCNSTRLNVTQPDILVTVNFTELGIRSDSIGNVARNSVQVVFGLANQTKSVLDNTSPVTLIPGMNAFAMANMVLRKQFRLSAFSIFGLFDNHNTFLVSEIAHLITDPSSSPLITHSPDVATLRIVLQVDVTLWRVFQDSHEKSILKGISSVGGLWTSLCGIFAILFGSSILRVMFNLKPFSLFGLIHAIQSEQLRDSCLKEYPRIPYELESSPGNRGIVSFISDYFLDLDFLRPDQQPDAIPLTSTMPSGGQSPVMHSSLFNDDSTFTDIGPLLRADPFSAGQQR